MCIGCWNAEGSPAIRNDRTALAAQLIKQCNEFGPLHIIVSDMNVDDDHIEFCAEQPGKSKAETVLLDLFRLMDIDERISAFAIAEWWI